MNIYRFSIVFILFYDYFHSDRGSYQQAKLALGIIGSLPFIIMFFYHLDCPFALFLNFIRNSIDFFAPGLLLRIQNTLKNDRYEKYCEQFGFNKKNLFNYLICNTESGSVEWLNIRGYEYKKFNEEHHENKENSTSKD